jgi:hypothetical protein
MLSGNDFGHTAQHEAVHSPDRDSGSGDPDPSPDFVRRSQVDRLRRRRRPRQTDAFQGTIL